MKEPFARQTRGQIMCVYNCNLMSFFDEYVAEKKSKQVTFNPDNQILLFDADAQLGLKEYVEVRKTNKKDANIVEES